MDPLIIDMGLVLQVSLLGHTMSLEQLFTTVTLLFIFKRLFGVVSNRAIVLLSAISWLILASSFPFLNLVAVHIQQRHSSQWSLYALLGLMIVIRILGLIYIT